MVKLFELNNMFLCSNLIRLKDVNFLYAIFEQLNLFDFFRLTSMGNFPCKRGMLS